MKVESTEKSGPGKPGKVVSSAKEGGLGKSGMMAIPVNGHDPEETGMKTSSELSDESDMSGHKDACCCARTTVRDESEKKALINRCNRVEGQIRGIRGMLERDMYCDDVLNQVAAVRSAMDSISRLILERHMKSCLIDRIRAGELEVVDELLGTLQKMMR